MDDSSLRCMDNVQHIIVIQAPPPDMPLMLNALVSAAADLGGDLTPPTRPRA